MKALISLFTLLGIGTAFAQNADRQPKAVHKWSVQDPDSSSSVFNGLAIKTINVGGLRVDVALRDTGSKMRADMFIENRRNERVEVRPETFRLTITDGGQKELKYNDPDQMAKSVRRRAGWAAAMTAMGGAMQQRTTTSQTNESGTVGVIGPGGSASGTYSGTSTTTTTGPDDEARRRADAQVGRIGENARNTVAGIEATALRANTVFPAKSLYGAVYFDRSKAKQMVLTVVIDSEEFEFPFTWEKR